MKKISSILQSCILFKNYSPQQIENILNYIDYEVRDFSKQEIIAFEEDECNKLNIILKGNVDIQSIFPSGKVFTLTNLNEADIFGEAIIFSKSNHFPVTVTALTDVTIFSIQKDQILSLLSTDTIFLQSFLTLLSNKLLMLNKRTRLLSLDTIRAKLCSFMISEYKKQKTNKLVIGLSKKSLAEYLGVQRPSLSREFIKMKNDDLIDYDKNHIYIKDIVFIEDELLR
ncbi:Crp/Fnr family transcriptional regulator [Lutibacter sp. B2]|nr:Crp/Fnr family transcriptional regulator [Lutibacter sp. B2]